MGRVAAPYNGGFQENDEEASFRRYSSRGQGYPISHDREYNTGTHGIYPASRTHRPSPHEPRASGQSPESDSSSRPRSRIPVACGRCRKRKIRCSGDAGNGGPCTNCKNAGNDQCQFLRVSSEPAQMKNECAAYDYDASGGAASRLNCRIPFGPQYTPHNPTPLPVDGYQYRNNTLPSYQQYAVKPYYPMTSFGDFNGDELGYNLQSQLIGTEDLGVPSNYATSTSTRGWPTTPQLPKTPLYVEHSDTPYSHGQIQAPYHHGANFPLRSSMSSDHRNMSLNVMGTSLPPPVHASGERLLPYPTAHPGRSTQIGAVGAYPRSSADGLPSTATLQSQPFDPNCNYIRNVRQNMAAATENASLSSNSFMTSQSTSPESFSSSSQLTYGSQPSVSMSQQSASEMYHTPPCSQDLDSENSSSSSSSYAHNPSSSGSGEGCSKRPSIDSQGSTTTADGSLLPSLADAGRLANGQEYRYVPQMGTYNQGYPVPPILHHPAPVSRASISVGADHE